MQTILFPFDHQDRQRKKKEREKKNSSFGICSPEEIYRTQFDKVSKNKELRNMKERL